MLFAPAAWLQLGRPPLLWLQRLTRTRFRLDSVESGCIAFVRCRQANRLCLLQLAAAQSANAKTYRERHDLAVRRRRLSVLQPTYPRVGAPSKRASNRTGSDVLRSSTVVSSVVSQRYERGGEFGCGAMATHCTLRCKLAHLCQRAARLHIYVVCASFTSEALARACAPKGRDKVVNCTPSDVAAQLVLRRRKAALRVRVAPLGAWTKFGGARRRARAGSGFDTQGWVPGEPGSTCVRPRMTDSSCRL
jgi:hypothetical protein